MSVTVVTATSIHNGARRWGVLLFGGNIALYWLATSACPGTTLFRVAWVMVPFGRLSPFDRAKSFVHAGSVLCDYWVRIRVNGRLPRKDRAGRERARSCQRICGIHPARSEGDIQQMPADFAVTELWEVLGGTRTGRDSDAQITVFDSVGFALEDFTALRFMHTAALILGLGELLTHIPQMADPKNLFGTLQASPSRTAPALTVARCM